MQADENRDIAGGKKKIIMRDPMRLRLEGFLETHGAVCLGFCFSICGSDTNRSVVAVLLSQCNSDLLHCISIYMYNQPNRRQCN